MCSPGNSLRHCLCWLLFLVSGPLAEGREKPVRVIVPFAPGGGSDTLARLFVRSINDSDLSQAPWVVVNIPGAGGTIGSRRARNAPPDGKTLLFLHDGILTAQFAGQALYGPDAFTPVAATGSVGMVICVGETSGIADLPSLLEQAATRPNTITFAANLGAPSYFMAKILEHSHGEARFRFVQSGGGASRFADLSGGHITASAFSVSEYLSFRSGGLRAISYFGKERHPSMPDIPTATEAGLPIVYQNLQGWWMPKGTSPETVQDMEKLLAATMKRKEVAGAFSSQQIEPLFLTGRELEIALQKKAKELESLELGHRRQPLPNPAYPALLLCTVGIGLSLTGRAGSRPSPATRRALRSSTWIILCLIVAYLFTLHFFQGSFLAATVGFLLATTLATVGSTDWWKTAITAVTIPLALHLFLSSLLGYQLP